MTKREILEDYEKRIGEPGRLIDAHPLKTKREHVAVVGSRGITELPCDVESFLDSLLQNRGRFTVVSGGARGVDTAAVKWANGRHLETKVLLADWDTHGKAAGMLRNQQIVDVSDVVVAVWDGESRGTKDTIAKALRERVELHVFMYRVCK